MCSLGSVDLVVFEICSWEVCVCYRSCCSEIWVLSNIFFLGLGIKF